MRRLIDQLEAVEDLRVGNAKKHKLGDILFLAIAAGVADALIPRTKSKIMP